MWVYHTFRVRDIDRHPQENEVRLMDERLAAVKEKEASLRNHSLKDTIDKPRKKIVRCYIVKPPC